MHETEIINMALGIASAPFFLFGSRSRKVHGGKLLHAGFFLVVGALFFTVAEEYFLSDFFNLLEHISFAFAGILFAAGCRALRRYGIRGKGLAP